MSSGFFDLSINVKAIDKASANLKQIEKNAGKMSENMKRHFKETAETLHKVGKTALITGGAIVAGLGTAAKASSDFSKSMSNVSTLVDTNVESMDAMKASVLDMSKRVPVGLVDLSGALYDVRSAGINAKDSMFVLENSAKLGVAGLGSTGESVDLVTSSLNAFNLKGREADKIYDNIFKTCKYGKTTITGIAQGFGSVAGTVAGANIKVDEYLAAVAALTTTGMPAAVVHTQIKAAISGLTRSTKESDAVFKKLGAKSFKDLVSKSGGMVNAFNQIVGVLGHNDAAILKVVGSTEAYNAMLGLTGNQSGTFKSALKDMRTGTDLFNEGYQKQLKENAAQMQILQNTMQASWVKVGNTLLPILTKGAKGIGKVVNMLDKMPKPLKDFLTIGALVTGVGLIGFGGLAIGVSSAMSAVANCGAAMTGIVGKFPMVARGLLTVSRAFMTFGAAIMTTPVGWVVAGVVLIAGAAVLIRKYWLPITEFFKGVWSGLKEAMKPTIDQFKQALKPLAPLGDAFKKVGKAISDFLKPVTKTSPAVKNAGVGFGKLIGGFLKGAIAVGKFILKINPLTGSLIQIYKNFDKITKSISAAKDKVKGFFSMFKGKNNVNLNATVKGSSGETAPAAKSSGKYPKFDVGSSGITKTGMAMVHEGEHIVPKSQVKKNASNTITFAPQITITGSAGSGIEAKLEQTMKKLFEQFMREFQGRQARLAF